MALSDDQKAILRLLSQRGEQGYADLSALMGVDAAEVHRRAKEAAAALEAEGIPAPVILEPPGGGGSPPSVAKDGEAPAGGPPPPKPPPAPKPALPKGPPKPPLKKELKLLENRGLWAILAGAAVVILFVVFVLGGSGDDGGDSTTTATTAESGGAVAALEAAAEQGSRKVTKASLKAVDGGDATGVAVFGRVKKSLALQVAAEGLEATGKGESYTIWLAASPDKMLPLASTNEVGEDGKLAAQVEAPVEVLAYLANETFGQIAITRTEDSRLEATLREATKQKQAPAYTGEEVLLGDVTGPIVGAARRG
ncbi:MAG TPA: hypothetical protein VNC15_04700 [Solirubrobacterales bacterium]|nr:hypothetical protein [Solirubrobacterales bacterium]